MATLVSRHEVIDSKMHRRFRLHVSWFAICGNGYRFSRQKKVPRRLNKFPRLNYITFTCGTNTVNSVAVSATARNSLALGSRYGQIPVSSDNFSTIP